MLAFLQQRLTREVDKRKRARKRMPPDLRRPPSAAKSLCSALSGLDRGPTLEAIVASGRIEPGRLSVTLCPIAIAERLGVPTAQIRRGALSLVGEFTLRRRGIEAKLALANTPSALDRTLIKTVALGWVWFEEIKAGPTMQAIANREGVSQRRVAHLVDLASPAPDIVRSIVEGRQPPTLTADSLRVAVAVKPGFAAAAPVRRFCGSVSLC